VELPPIAAPDEAARRAADARLAALAIPTGGLGRLGEVATWLAAVQGACPPRPPRRPRVIVTAAAHGIAAPVSPEVPPAPGIEQQVAAVREHGAPVVVAAPVAGAAVRLLDLTVPGPHLVRELSGRIDREDALTADEVRRAVALGRAVADEEVDSGTDLLAVGALGAGATTPASVLVSVLTGVEPVAVVGRGSGVDDAGWMREAAAVRDARRRAMPHVRDPLSLLRVAGGADLAVLAGVLVQAAARRTPVLLDGLVTVAAAMVADELVAQTRAWWLAAHRSPEPAVGRALVHLGLTPLLELGAWLGDGSSAVAAIPLVQMAARLLAETTAVGAPPS